MADPNETLDPEPVDAEFEPADESGRSDSGKTTGPGWLSLFTVFLLASAAGGALGYAGQTWLASQPATDAGAADERAALTDAISALETRLAEAEATPPATAGLETRLAALEARIETLTDTPGAAPPDLSDIESRLDTLESAPDRSGDRFDPSDLIARLDALETGLDDIRARADQALQAAQASEAGGVDPQILQNLTDRLASLEQAADRAAAAPAFDDPSPQIAALEARIAGLEDALGETRTLAQTAQTAADSAARTASEADGEEARASRRLAARALALTSLREMANTGEGFEAERAALARLWRDNADLAAMAGTARAGVPTLDQLATRYPGQAIRDAAGPGRVFFGLIEVRRSETGDDETGALAITALAEDRLAQDDLDGAIALTERLEGDALEAARDWLVAARARQDLDRRLARLRQALADDAATQGDDPS